MKYVIVLGFLAVLVGVFAYSSLFSVDDYAATSEEVEMAETDEAIATAPAEAFSGTDTVEVLRLRNQDLECTIAYESAEQGAVEGTMFTSGGVMRGDFLTDTPDLSGKMLTSMILSDTQMEVWTDMNGEKQGVRVDLAALDGMSTDDANAPVSTHEPVEYSCKPWSPVDRSVFEAPGDVLFYDFGQILQGGMEYGTVYDGAEMP